MTLKLNSLSNVYAAYATAWAATVEAIDEAMTDAIEDPRYSWYRAPDPRDIVDTGALRDSQQTIRSGDTAYLSWGNGTVDYAIDVHEGEGRKPARRWTREAIRGDETAPLEWQNERAILNVPTYFTSRFRAAYRD